MASAIVTATDTVQPSGSAALVTFKVVLVPNNGAPIVEDTVDVVITAGDSPNTINTNLGTAVRALATRYGVTLPTNSVLALGFIKA